MHMESIMGIFHKDDMSEPGSKRGVRPDVWGLRALAGARDRDQSTSARNQVCCVSECFEAANLVGCQHQRVIRQTVAYYVNTSRAFLVHVRWKLRSCYAGPGRSSSGAARASPIPTENGTHGR